LSALVVVPAGCKLSATGLMLPDNLPTEQWSELVKDLVAARSGANFALGDALNFGQDRKYGETYTHASEITGLTTKHLCNVAWVTRRVTFSFRNEKLDWSHHVYVAPLKPDDQVRFLNLAVEKHLNPIQLKNLIRAERARAAATELPDGVYKVIYADPPWDYLGGCFPPQQIAGGTDRQYPTMPLNKICELPVKNIAAEDSVLFLWVPAPMLENAFEVIRAWGFDYKEQFVWDKVKHGMGRYMSMRHENLLIATRGSGAPDNHKDLRDSVQSIPRTEHSRKPEAFREIIDSMYPTGPRIELFARGALPTPWVGWGNEYQESQGEPVETADEPAAPKPEPLPAATRCSKCGVEAEALLDDPTFKLLEVRCNPCGYKEPVEEQDDPPLDYTPRFLSDEEADALFAACSRLEFHRRKNPRNPKTLIRNAAVVFTEKHSRRADHIGNPRSLAEAPEEFRNLAAKLTTYVGNGRRVNYLSVVRYLDGTDHMGWHQHRDDKGHDTPVLIVSTGAERNFSWREKGKQETAQHRVAEHGSLIVLSSNANDTHEHAVLGVCPRNLFFSDLYAVSY